MGKALSRKKAALVKRYFRLIKAGSLTEAGRILTDIEHKMEQTVWHKGYLNALRGMLYALRSKDTRYVYIGRINLEDRNVINGAKKEFLAQSKNPLQGDFEQGFFSAWSNYLKNIKLSTSRKEAKLSTEAEND